MQPDLAQVRAVPMFRRLAPALLGRIAAIADLASVLPGAKFAARAPSRTACMC